MALRTPPAHLAPPHNLEALKQEAALQEPIAWQTYEVELVTPMYGGGVTAGEVDKDFPIRPTAIRGQLRFWWRFLAQHKYKQSPEQVRKAERLIWGGIAATGSTASKVMIRVVQPKKVSVQPWARYEKKENGKGYKIVCQPWANAPYALFPGQGKAPGSTDSKDPASLLQEAKWQLAIRLFGLSESEEKQFTEALRWWSTFGGVGARTRRGLGAVNLPALSPVTPEEAAEAGCLLHFAKGNSATAGDAWERAVHKLFEFRQGKNIGRNPGETPGRPGRSHWPEAAAIRQITGEFRIKPNGIRFENEDFAAPLFPRAMFGLPIIFHFQHDNRDTQPDPEDSTLQACITDEKGALKVTDRMASPLILRPYRGASGKWRSAALLMPSLLKSNSRLQLSYRGDQTAKAHPLAINAEENKSIRSDCPMKTYRDNKPAHPLQAFLNYFEA